MSKEIFSKYSTNAEELLRVDGRLVVQTLKCASVNVELVGEPLIGVTRAAEFVADKVAYVYLHSGCCLRAWLPIPYMHSDDHRQKKKASNLVSNVRSWKLPL